MKKILRFSLAILLSSISVMAMDDESKPTATGLQNNKMQHQRLVETIKKQFDDLTAMVDESPLQETQAIVKMKEGLTDSNFTQRVAHDMGLNQSFKNLFFNGFCYSLFTKDNLLIMAAMRKKYDSQKTGLSYSKEMFPSSPHDPLVFAYKTMSGSVIPVTLYSIFYGILQGMDQIHGQAVEPSRHRTEQDNIVDGLGIISDELTKAISQCFGGSAAALAEDDMVAIKLDPKFVKNVAGAFNAISPKIQDLLKGANVSKEGFLLVVECIKAQSSEIDNEVKFASPLKIQIALSEFLGKSINYESSSS